MASDVGFSFFDKYHIRGTFLIYDSDFLTLLIQVTAFYSAMAIGEQSN